MNNLGLMYENGKGVAKNYCQARDLYEKAVAAGYPEAKANLERVSESMRQNGKK
jgi:TPR repeat protein